MRRCQSVVCKKPLPVETKFGNDISKRRQKKQKYCDNSCARTEAARQAREKAVVNEEAIKTFLYSTKRTA